ncbi:HNH endonuclease [Acinetobacter pittii]|uniref:HNH endonuclease n=1 Tax=Acinetobacter pittii TaxID=48296 RepID=UPI0027022F1C|nr:HNH endonuclease [Acinetobacter pittii]MDO7536634.1 HNH endonuclease [Acinetobacter pittii]
MNCSLCNIPFNKTKDSEEHIIPQSIGGKKTVTGFICENCNNSKGNEWDSKLAKHLNPLSIFFNIKRERGEVPSMKLSTDTGHDYVVSANGEISLPKPIYEEIDLPNEKKTTIHIKARNEKEAQQQIMRAKKSYPQIDEEQLIKQIKTTTAYIDDHFIFTLGGLDEACIKSIVKTALALAVKANIASEDCKYAKDYLQNITSTDCFGYFYAKDPILNRPREVPLHCVFVKSDPNHKIIWAYIEFFALYRGLVCLSDSYEGQYIESYYAIDPRTSKQLSDLDISLDLSIEELKKSIDLNDFPLEKLKEIMDEIIPSQLKLAQDKERNRVITHAVTTAYAQSGVPEGETFTEEQWGEMVKKVVAEMEPWLINQVKTRQRKS